MTILDFIVKYSIVEEGSCQSNNHTFKYLIINGYYYEGKVQQATEGHKKINRGTFFILWLLRKFTLRK